MFGEIWNILGSFNWNNPSETKFVKWVENNLYPNWIIKDQKMLGVFKKTWVKCSTWPVIEQNLQSTSDSNGGWQHSSFRIFTNLKVEVPKERDTRWVGSNNPRECQQFHVKASKGPPSVEGRSVHWRWQMRYLKMLGLGYKGPCFCNNSYKISGISPLKTNIAPKKGGYFSRKLHLPTHWFSGAILVFGKIFAYIHLGTFNFIREICYRKMNGWFSFSAITTIE